MPATIRNGILGVTLDGVNSAERLHPDYAWYDARESDLSPEAIAGPPEIAPLGGPGDGPNLLEWQESGFPFGSEQSKFEPVPDSSIGEDEEGVFPGVYLVQKEVREEDPPGINPWPGGILNEFGWAGTPTQLGVFTVVVPATAAHPGTAGFPGETFEWHISLAPGCPLIALTDPDDLPRAYIGFRYLFALEAENGVAPYTWDIPAGALPDGLSLSPLGLLSGTPTEGGEFTFTLRATDDNGCPGVAEYTIAVGGLIIKVGSGSPTTLVDRTADVLQADFELGLNRRSTARIIFGENYIPNRLDEVVLYARDGVTPVFGGIILKRSVRGMAPSVEENATEADCVDYSVFFDDASVTLSYDEAVAVEDVIADIVDQALADYDLTYTPVATGLTLEPFSWVDVTVTKAFKDIFDKTGVVVRTSPSRAVLAFVPGTDPAPIEIADANINAFDLAWTDGEQLTPNTVDLLCGPSGNGVAEQEWTADGVETEWEVDIPAAKGNAEPAHRANAYLSPVDATNFSDGDTIGLGSSTYTFRTSLVGDVAGEVLIGATVEDSLANLNAAINLAGGSVYAPSTPANADASSYLRSATMLEADALTPGAAGNAIAVTSSNDAVAFWYGEGNIDRETMQLGADATGAAGWTQGYILEDGAVARPLDVVGSGAFYEWDVTDGRGTVSLGSGTVPPAGTVLQLHYLAVYPFHARYSTGSPPITYREAYPEIITYAEGLARAIAIHAREASPRRDLEITTDEGDGVLPGQALTVATTSRWGLNGIFLVASVSAHLVTNEIWDYTIVVQEAPAGSPVVSPYRGSYVDEWKALTAGGSSLTSPATVTTTPIDTSAVVEADLSLSDVTTADVSVDAHGFAPKAPGDPTKFLNGDDPPAWTTPPSAAISAAGAANVATSENQSAGAGYADLSTSGPSVTLMTGTAVIIVMSAVALKTATGNSAFISVDVSGATTIAASDANGTMTSSYAASHNLPLARVLYLSGLTPGSNTFKLQYKNDGGTQWSFFNRSISVFAL